MTGGNQIKSACRGQSVVALSSAEAEYYALVSCVSECLGEQAILRDFGLDVKLSVNMDASSGAAIANRRGLAKIKHLHTAFLWVQNLVSESMLTIHKVHTSRNPADMLTKPCAWSQIKDFMEAMGWHFS
eukprot:587900-Amphidinium_carterae.1